MNWDFDFSYSLWWNFKAQVVSWRSRCRELELWVQGLDQMNWNFDFVFSFLVIELQTSSCLSRSRFRELEIWAQGLAHMSWHFEYFFDLCDWTSNLKLFYESLVAESLKSDLKGWLKWVENLIFLILCGWTSKLKLFCEGLIVETLKSEPMAWLKWAKI
jgi:hypothetical protein